MIATDLVLKFMNLEQNATNTDSKLKATPPKPQQAPPPGPSNPNYDCEDGPDLPVNQPKKGEPRPPPGKPCQRKKFHPDKSKFFNDVKYFIVPTNLLLCNIF